MNVTVTFSLPDGSIHTTTVWYRSWEAALEAANADQTSSRLAMSALDVNHWRMLTWMREKEPQVVEAIESQQQARTQYERLRVSAKAIGLILDRREDRRHCGQQYEVTDNESGITAVCGTLAEVKDAISSYIATGVL